MQKEKQLKQHFGLKIALLIVFCITCFLGTYFVSVYENIVNTADKIHVDIKDEKERNKTNKKIKATKPISFLLMGIDTGAEDRIEAGGNSDTMIVMTVNPKTETTSMLSIPRDSLAQIIGTKEFTMQKINSAYLFGGLNNETNGGAKMAVDTVNNFLNIPIDYYVSINMGGLVQIVNAVGGVDVEVPFDFSYDGCDFKKGKMHLDGRHSLAYARMRYHDPRGDFGRQERQQQVISSIMTSAASLNSILGYQKILDSLANNINTNLTFNEMVNIFNGYKKSANHIVKKQVKMITASIKGSDYVLWSTPELQEFSSYLRNQLELPAEELRNEVIRQNKLNTQFDWESQDNDQSYYIYR